MYNSTQSMSKKIITSLSVVLTVLLLLLPIKASAQFGNGIEPPFGENNKYTKDITNDPLNANNAFTTFELIVSNIIALLTVLGSLVFITYFMLGAINWITSGGDTAKVGKARDQMLQGVLGLIVLTLMYALIGLVGSIVGIDILNPAKVLKTLVP